MSNSVPLKKILPTALAQIVFAFLLCNQLSAQKDQLEKTWLTNGNSSKIQMYMEKDGSFSGKLTWIKDPIDKATGKPKTDLENPNDDLRSKPLLGLVIMTGYRKNPEKPDEYVDGKIYDPSHGRTYCAKIIYKGTYLDLRGYICHIPFLGRTEVWTLTDDVN